MQKDPVSPALNFSVEERLAVYGSLAPGRANAHILTPLVGTWLEGTVRGRLHDRGWGAALGYPGICLGGEAPVPVALFCSHDLPAYWSKLDEFEGPEYRRVVAEVLIEGRSVAANIYELRPDAPASDV